MNTKFSGKSFYIFLFHFICYKFQGVYTDTNSENWFPVDQWILLAKCFDMETSELALDYVYCINLRLVYSFANGRRPDLLFVRSFSSICRGQQLNRTKNIYCVTINDWKEKNYKDNLIGPIWIKKARENHLWIPWILGFLQLLPR